MGEWSEYFEDFPEENSANYDERGRYCAPNSPEGYQLAQSRRIQAAKAVTVRRQCCKCCGRFPQVASG